MNEILSKYDLLTPAEVESGVIAIDINIRQGFECQRI